MRERPSVCERGEETRRARPRRRVRTIAPPRATQRRARSTTGRSVPSGPSQRGASSPCRCCTRRRDHTSAHNALEVRPFAPRGKGTKEKQHAPSQRARRDPSASSGARPAAHSRNRRPTEAQRPDARWLGKAAAPSPRDPVRAARAVRVRAGDDRAGETDCGGALVRVGVDRVGVLEAV